MVIDFGGKKFVKYMVFENGSYLFEDDFNERPKNLKLLGRMNVSANAYYSFDCPKELHKYILKCIKLDFGV